MGEEDYLYKVFKEASRRGASDVHIKPDKIPFIRVSGKLLPLDEFRKVEPTDIQVFLTKHIRGEKEKALKDKKSIDFAVNLEGIGRFRVNAYYQMGEIALAVRLIPTMVSTIRELNLPPQIETLALEERGLILVTGTAGVGKSTTLAAMLNHINKNKRVKIITIEDPIEYVIQENLAIISQREVGIDTNSFFDGLREALRQDPNVIMVGEMRDKETVMTALLAAETGHLVLSTIHTLNAPETINRIINMFPMEFQHQIRLQLAMVLKAVISQRLVITKDGTGLVPAVEILVNTKRVQDIILDEARLPELLVAIEEGFIPYGMQSFDQSLYFLYRRGLVDEQTMLTHASRPDVLKLRLKGITSGVGGESWDYIDKLVKEL